MKANCVVVLHRMNESSTRRTQSRYPYPPRRCSHHRICSSWLMLLKSTIVLLPFMTVIASVSSSTSSSPSSIVNNNKIPIVIGIDGGTESIRACCFNAIDGTVIGTACAVPYATTHPSPGWAEQNPVDWYKNLGIAVQQAIQSIKKQSKKKYNICGLCIDSTCCSVVMINRTTGQALRPCILWMDQRAAQQSATIMDVCKSDPALLINCGGSGPISAEWMICKSLWLYENNNELWGHVDTVICEYQDYINYKLTGVICASSCNAASRWHWNGIECINEASETDLYPGRPISLYTKLGIPELADKLPQRCIPMGTLVGYLTQDAAKHLGVETGLPVIQGGPDAFVGMIGLGCIETGQLCLITGSSHLHCVVTDQPTTATGIWGAYRGAPLPTLNFAEGGQSSTGSIIRWIREKIFQTSESYAKLDEQASLIPPGSDGLIALETFQGSRTPVTDPLARGAFIGLTLSHTRAHLYRSLLESVCFGTRACIEGLESAGHTCNEIILAGGITRSKLWLQMHADVTNKPVIVCQNSDAPLLGCAVLAAVGVGIHKTVPDAVRAMVRTAQRIEPNPQRAAIYDIFYKQVYSKVASTVQPLTDAIHICQKDITNTLAQQQKQQEGSGSSLNTATSLSGGGIGHSLNSITQHRVNDRESIVSPSLLACNFANIEHDIQQCIDTAGLHRFHVDIFDGVYLDSPFAFTFGPLMVQAIRKAFPSEEIELDLHICVDRPARYIEPMAKAGGTRFIFQLEALEDMKQTLSLIQHIVDSGMKCGISINPKTAVEDLYPLLETGLVDVVDILAVEPGFGGQEFQSIVLAKIKTLREWRSKNVKLQFDIMVDGGLNDQTVEDIKQAGADILVAGSFLFQHSKGIKAGVDSLMGQTL